MAEQNECEYFEGVLWLHSETGTEGGDWALQDKRHISKVDPLPPGTEDGPSGLFTFSFAPDGKYTSRELLLSELPKEDWSREGLHILADGDYLFIFDKENPEKIVWEGVIMLRQYELFTEKTSTGMWIHADQDGVERSVWEKFFLENYPAKLVPVACL